MTTFAVLSAVRIHDWLTRTTELRLLRGASEALRRATHPDILALPAGVAWCDEVGSVSGVIVVTVSDGAPADKAMTDIAATLRDALPETEFEAWWADADDYITAYTRAADDALRGGGSDPGVGRLVVMPPILDVPVVHTCSTCRREPVDTSLTLVPGRDPGDPPTRYGRDCHSRASNSDRATPPSGVAGRLAHNFEELARHGGCDPIGVRRDSPVRRTKTDNHVATISADGNAIGGLMRALAATGGDLSESFGNTLAHVRRGIAGQLDVVTGDAVRHATKAVSLPGQQIAPAICHIMGGDDILLSVPAPLAWRFTESLLAAFDDGVHRDIRAPVGKALAEARTEADLQVASDIRTVLKRVSLGVGMTFAHASHPFADTDRIAGGAIRIAKKAGRGRTSGVCWVDITDDLDLVPDRFVSGSTSASDLAYPCMAPGVFGFTRSAQAALTGLLTDEWGGRTEQVIVDAAGLAIRRWADRTGNRGLPGSLDPSASGVCALADLRTLRDQLSRARWWPQSDTSTVVRRLRHDDSEMEEHR